MNSKKTRPGPTQQDGSTRSSGGPREVWEKRSDDELEQVSRDVMLGILRSLQASSFRVEKARDGAFHCTFFEGQLADELGLTTTEVYGKPVEEVFPEEVHNELQGRLQRALEGEVQEWIVEHNGRHYEFQLPAAGLFTAGSAVGSIRDVSDRVVTDKSKSELMDRLEEAHKEAEQLNYTLSHDLRNPLTVITTMCEVAEHEIRKGKGEPIERINKIRAAADRVNRMLTDILKLSRAQREKPEYKDVNVSRLASAVLQELESTQPDRKVEYRVDPGLHVYADRALVRDLLENLLSNAWKYTLKEDDPHIWVEEKKIDDQQWICVRDNGIGFAEDEKTDLFTAFRRLDSAKDFEGTGVGLATAKRIVERHDGQIKGDGRLGKGATFSFTFPDKRERESKPSGRDLKVVSSG